MFCVDETHEMIAVVRNKNAVAYPGAFSRSFPSSYVGFRGSFVSTANFAL
jgi:hypothetical protein